MQGRSKRHGHTLDLVSDDELDLSVPNKESSNHLVRTNLEVGHPAKRRKLFNGILAGEDSTYDLETALYEVNEKKTRKFEALSVEAQQQCIRAISRLFLFKGSKRDVITRSQLLEYLGKIDLEYKAHCDVVLEKVQEVLLSSTGYLIIDGASIRGCSSGNKNDYYLVNTLNNHENLQQILSWHWAEEGQGTSTMTAVGKASSLSAFALIIFHCIFNSPAYTIPCKDLLRNLRKIDSRFPESLPAHLSKSMNSAAPIKELEEDFVSLLSRLKKEHYIEIAKDKQDPDDTGKQLISFGPRFFLDIGKKTLLKSYFAILGQPVDERSLQELMMEEREQEIAEN